MHRLRWDPSFTDQAFIVGYEDRFQGVLEVPMTQWRGEQTDEEFIPQHRILFFKRMIDGVKVWDKKEKLDLVFGSGIVQEKEEVMEEEEEVQGQEKGEEAETAEAEENQEHEEDEDKTDEEGDQEAGETEGEEGKDDDAEEKADEMDLLFRAFAAGTPRPVKKSTEEP
ncbi:MAG: hypothetical protein M1823_000524 [Watsoniomyces obsoletus]|nr:MAG: hypothetical protein M1823_000524 [Watsoniomyces obsoletus]